jgi:hypothetical protein
LILRGFELRGTGVKVDFSFQNPAQAWRAQLNEGRVPWLSEGSGIDSERWSTAQRR